MKRQLDQEKLITDLRHEVFSLRDSNFAWLHRIETLERNVRARTSPSPLPLPGGMQIFVKTLTGKTIIIDEDSD
jgi:hypothetical protein